MTTTQPAPAATDPASGPSRLALFGLMLGVVLGTVDGTVVGTALPTIVGELGGLDNLSWVVTAYLLAASVATPLRGKLGDLYGHRTTYLLSISLFLIGSVLCGLAQDMGQLIAFRALQGIGGGGLFVGALSLIGSLLPPSRQGRAQSMFGAVLPVAFIGGPLIGGVITDHLNWRWVFYVNLPLGVLALLLVTLTVRLHTPRREAHIDFAGAGLLTTGILALTLLATWGGDTYDWASVQILGLAALGAVSLGWFVVAERRAVEPVIPPRLFASRNFTLAQVLSLLAGALMLAVGTYLPQYTQFVHGQSSTASGLLLMPLMLGMMGMQMLTGRWVARSGRYRHYPIIGGAVVLVGSLVLLLLGTGTHPLAASALTLLLGAGLGFLQQSTLLITLNSAQPQDIGAASGTVTLVRTLGGTLGIAALGAVYTGSLQSTMTDRLGAGNGPDVAAGLTPAQLAGLAEPEREAFRWAVTNGLHTLAVGLAVLAVLIFVLAWFVREVPLRDRPAAGQEAGPEASGDERTREKETARAKADPQAPSHPVPLGEKARPGPA